MLLVWVWPDLPTHVGKKAGFMAIASFGGLCTPYEFGIGDFLVAKLPPGSREHLTCSLRCEL